MIWYGIIFLVFLGTAWYNRKDGIYSAISSATVAALFACVPLGWLGHFAYGHGTPQQVGDYRLAAVSDGSSVQGSAFLFAGYIEQAQVFNYYQQVGDKTYKRDWQRAIDSVVVEDQSNGNAFLRKIEIVPNKWYGFTWDTKTVYEFHVPPGSVQQEITLDNK